MLKYFMPAVLCTALLCLISLPAMAQSATGYWQTENERSVIYIHPCEEDKDELCGDIHWIIDDGMQYDSENPDPTLRNRPLCSLTVRYAA